MAVMVGGIAVPNSRHLALFSLAHSPRGSLVFHVLYLHRLSSSSNPGYGTNNRIHFYTWLVHKDTLACIPSSLVGSTVHTGKYYTWYLLSVSVLYSGPHIATGQ